MLEKFAEDQKLAQLSEQRRRMKMAEHRREVERLIEEKRKVAPHPRLPACLHARNVCLHTAHATPYRAKAQSLRAIHPAPAPTRPHARPQTLPPILVAPRQL